MARGLSKQNLRGYYHSPMTIDRHMRRRRPSLARVVIILFGKTSGRVKRVLVQWKATDNTNRCGISVEVGIALGTNTVADIRLVDVRSELNDEQGDG